MAQNRITIPQWQGIKAGQEVETGFPGSFGFVRRGNIYRTPCI